MRKELFKHEITLLRDTFGRLLRRHAETNLIKLINKTHPADLAIVFRYFNDDEQVQVFNLMNSDNHTLEFLVELDDTIIEKLLNIQNADRIAELIQNASTNDQSYILGTINESQAKSVIDLLKKAYHLKCVESLQIKYLILFWNRILYFLGFRLPR